MQNYPTHKESILLKNFVVVIDHWKDFIETLPIHVNTIIRLLDMCE